MACLLLAVLAAGLGACSSDPGPVAVDAAPLTGDAATACRTFLDSLPSTLAGLEERDVTPSDAPARAWGDDGMVLTCGAPQPPDFNKYAGCELIRGVGWYFPQSEYSVDGVDLLATAVGYDPRLSLLVPAAYRGDISLEVFSELADYVKAPIRLVKRCR